MKIFFETLGCPKNFNDTEVAEGILIDQGFEPADYAEEADVIIVNTCGFIGDAKEESINRIFELDQVKKSGAKLMVSGCLSKRYAEELFEEMPEVDAFIGVNEYDRIAELVNRVDKGERFKEVSSSYSETLCYEKRNLPENPYTETIKIAEGCNNTCAYCIIPKIRGRFRSKPEEAIIKEAVELAEAGTKELVLIAQDTACYGIDLYGEYRLAHLLKELCKIEKLKWIRLLYCYEDKITDELIEVMATEPKVCRYIDIPLQHASDNVLKNMNRHATGSSIENIIEKLRAKVPGIHIRTTLISGFPGETEEDYLELVDFVEKEKFERLGVFAYSQEEGTVAGEMECQVPEEIREQRKNGIMRRQIDISLEHNKEKTGKIFDVIIDEIQEDGTCIGRTEFDAPEIDNSVIFTPCKQEHKPGDFVKVKITDAYDYDLVGVEIFE